MREQILQNPNLFSISGRSYEENKVKVEICSRLLVNGDLDDR